VNRRYDMQETRLAQHLAHVFGTTSDPKGDGSRLARWNADGSSGCLGVEVGVALGASAVVSASYGTFIGASSVT